MVTRTTLSALVAALAVAVLSGTSCVERPSTAAIDPASPTNGLAAPEADAPARAAAIDRQHREPPAKFIPYRETILREYPQDLVNMKHLAVLYERVGQLSKAEKLYRRMVALSKSSAEPVSLLTDLLRRTDRDAEARRLLIEHIDSSTDKAAAQRVFAQYLENADDHEMAQRAYEKAVQLAPKDARGCAALARFHARRGQWADAVKQQLRYLEKVGEAARPAAERELVGWLIEAKQFDEALAAGKDLQGHPDVGPEVMALVGRAHAMKKQQVKADQHFALAVKDAEVGAQTEFVVGQIRKAYGPKTAAEKLAKWVTLRKDNWQIRLLLGNMLVLERQYKAAETQLLRALKQDVSNHDRFLVTRHLGLTYYEMGDHKKSLEFYRKALALDPKDGITLNNLAWLLGVHLKDPDAAMPYVKRALEREPCNPHMLDTYCVVLMAKGKLAEAVKVLERAADIRPLPAILLHLGQAYQKMGRKEDAIRAYRRGWEKVKGDPGHPYYRHLHDTLKRLGEQPEGDDETDTPHDPTTETRARRPKD